MANTQINPITVAEAQTINRHLEQILNILKTKTVNLTPEERKKRRKMGDDNTGLVMETLDICNNHASLFPSHFDLNKFNQVWQSIRTIDTVFSKSQQIQETLEDGRMYLGMLAMDFEEEARGYIDLAAGHSQSLNAANEALKARFKKKKTAPKE